MKVFLLCTFGCLLVLSTWASPRTYQRKRQTGDLGAVAGQLGLSSLGENLVAASLDSVLSAEGPFTVFGPTNDAFSRVAADDVNAQGIVNILKYHVVPGAVFSSDLSNDLLLDTALDGKQIRINVYTVNGSPVVTAQCARLDLQKVDSEANNGVIHVVDDVLIPPVGTITDLVSNTENLSTLLTAVAAAGLADALAGDGPFTLFAPTNEAFANLGGLLDEVLADPDLLKRVLLYHVVPGTFCSAGLDDVVVNTLSGDELTITVSPGAVQVNNANVVGADFSVTNGVVHITDAVLLPPDLA